MEQSNPHNDYDARSFTPKQFVKGESLADKNVEMLPCQNCGVWSRKIQCPFCRTIRRARGVKHG